MKIKTKKTEDGQVFYLCKNQIISKTKYMLLRGGMNEYKEGEQVRRENDKPFIYFHFDMFIIEHKDGYKQSDMSDKVQYVMNESEIKDIMPGNIKIFNEEIRKKILEACPKLGFKKPNIQKTEHQYDNAISVRGKYNRMFNQRDIKNIIPFINSWKNLHQLNPTSILINVCSYDNNGVHNPLIDYVCDPEVLVIHIFIAQNVKTLFNKKGEYDLFRQDNEKEYAQTPGLVKPGRRDVFQPMIFIWNDDPEYQFRTLSIEERSQSLTLDSCLAEVIKTIKIAMCLASPQLGIHRIYINYPDGKYINHLNSHIPGLLTDNTRTRSITNQTHLYSQRFQLNLNDIDEWNWYSGEIDHSKPHLERFRRKIIDPVTYIRYYLDIYKSNYKIEKVHGLDFGKYFCIDGRSVLNELSSNKLIQMTKRPDFKTKIVKDGRVKPIEISIRNLRFTQFACGNGSSSISSQNQDYNIFDNAHNIRKSLEFLGKYLDPELFKTYLQQDTISLPKCAFWYKNAQIKNKDITWFDPLLPCGYPNNPLIPIDFEFVTIPRCNVFTVSCNNCENCANNSQCTNPLHYSVDHRRLVRTILSGYNKTIIVDQNNNFNGGNKQMFKISPSCAYTDYEGLIIHTKSKEGKLLIVANIDGFDQYKYINAINDSLFRMITKLWNNGDNISKCQILLTEIDSIFDTENQVFEKIREFLISQEYLFKITYPNIAGWELAHARIQKSLHISTRELLSQLITIENDENIEILVHMPSIINQMNKNIIFSLLDEYFYKPIIPTHPVYFIVDGYLYDTFRFNEDSGIAKILTDPRVILSKQYNRFINASQSNSDTGVQPYRYSRNLIELRDLHWVNPSSKTQSKDKSCINIPSDHCPYPRCKLDKDADTDGHVGCTDIFDDWSKIRKWSIPFSVNLKSRKVKVLKKFIKRTFKFEDDLINDAIINIFNNNKLIPESSLIHIIISKNDVVIRRSIYKQ